MLLRTVTVVFLHLHAFHVVDSCHPNPIHDSSTCAAPSNHAVAVLKGNAGVEGEIHLYEMGDHTLIVGALIGLTPGQHGFHIHQYGDLTSGCISAGPHFNPFGNTHGGPDSGMRHIGDLGSITAAPNGVARFEIKDVPVRLGGEHSVIGRSMVVHADVDDLGLGVGGKREESLKTGNAGARVACGVIGVAAPTP